MKQQPAAGDGSVRAVPLAQVRQVPLHAHSILRHAAAVHGEATVTSVSIAGSTTRASYAQVAERSRQRAAELSSLGIGPGDALVNMGVSSVEQLAWLNAALSLGATSHLMNPLLGPEQVLQLIAAARPSVLLHDHATGHLAAGVAGVVSVNMDESSGAPAGLLQPGGIATPFAEDTPAIVCYSSGTTGLPKAALYTHRSTVLHAWACALPDAMGLSANDRVLPLMQMFHATAWGAPFVCPLVGASLILVPPSRDPKQWYEWIEEHGATVVGAVTSHWTALAAYMQSNKLRFGKLRRTVVGGTRLPEAIARVIAEGFGVEVRHAWGMTETSPLATMERYTPQAGRLRHGKPVFGIELRTGDGIQAPKPLDELHVRGHWVAHRDDDAWLPTGDLAVIHADGHLEVIDRVQDALGGAAGTISSALVEYHARLVPGTADAALVRMASNEIVLAWVCDPHAQEAVVSQSLRQALTDEFDGWAPDRLVAVDALPYTHSAKVQKNQLRAVLARLAPPSADAR